MVSVCERLFCPSCEDVVPVQLVRKIGQNGTSFPYWQCHAGHNIHWDGKCWLPKTYLRDLGITYDDLPTEADYRSIPCAVCGELGTEEHHIAPRYMFGDAAGDYPTIYLCRVHHEFWHNTVTAFYGVEGSDAHPD